MTHVKDEDGRVLVPKRIYIIDGRLTSSTYLMKDYFSLDFIKLNIREEDRNYNCYHRIQKQEVKEVLKRISNNEVIRPDNVPIEV